MATAAEFKRVRATGGDEEETEMREEAERFSEVQRKRKRKLKSVDMDVGEDAAVKRPSFPPVDASATAVRHTTCSSRVVCVCVCVCRVGGRSSGVSLSLLTGSVHSRISG